MKSTNERLAMVAADEWLQPVEEEINRRFAMYRERLEAIEDEALNATFKLTAELGTSN